MRLAGRAARAWLLFHITGAGIVLWLCSGCAFMHHYDAQCGRVFDADTSEPIEGAAVVGLYHTVSDSVGGGVRQWAATQETVTDANGEFCLPATTIFEPRLPLSWFDDYVAIWVLKPSYTLINGSRTQANTFTRRATPTGTLVEYKLKKLTSIEERRQNLQIPVLREEVQSQWHEQMPYYYRLFNAERMSIGLKELKGGGRTPLDD